MKKIILIAILISISLSSCYTVGKVGGKFTRYTVNSTTGGLLLD